MKVFKHLTTVRTLDPSLDLSKMIPDEENEKDVTLCDVTDRQKRFNGLVLNCFQEVSQETELVKQLYDCTGGIVLLSRPLSELLPKVDILHQAAPCWTFVFEVEFRQNSVLWLNESVKFLDSFHIPPRITESSEEIKLRDFVAHFLNVKCSECCFSPILCCRDGRIQFYITGDEHAWVFTEAAATISVVSPSANLCSNQSCLKLLTSVVLTGVMNGELMKGLGGMIRSCKRLKRICLLGGNDYVCDFLEQLRNPGPCHLTVGNWYSTCILTSAGAVKLAGFLPMFNNIACLNLGLTECSAEAVSTLVLSITHKTLEVLVLRGTILTPAAAATLGRVPPEMLSLRKLVLVGSAGSAFKAEEMQSLFGGFNKTLPLKCLDVISFSVRGSLAPLIESFRHSPGLTVLYLINLDMDERDLCGLLESFRFFPKSAAPEPERQFTGSRSNIYRTTHHQPAKA